MKQWYGNDLAYIHDTGFGDYALRSATGILKILANQRIHEGLVVDLGCGSGLWAERLVRAGYNVLGMDVSRAMIAIARKRAPSARFRVGSFYKTLIPNCRAVTSIGECLNYLFDGNKARPKLRGLFGRIFRSLEPGGVFIFDIAEPGQLQQPRVRSFTEGEGWAVLVEKTEDQARAILTRRIITFRKSVSGYQRAEEVHRQQLFSVSEMTKMIRQAGFHVKTIHKYGNFALPFAHVAFVARKL
ncbi:MAG TPA: class I SAM-dependent methyltransferase [Acidobacteriota bacterium]|nr:class I SAM-dependent methyltransferase [Acidobacteriota bacterium]